MSIVLASLDSSTAAGPVLETAEGMAELTHSDVEVVCVRGDPAESVEIPASLAARREVPLRVLDGPVASVLLDTIGRPEVLLGVIGAGRTTSSRGPLGRTVRQVIEHTDKPVVVVPASFIPSGSVRRLLVPLEGTESSSKPVLEHLWPLLAGEVDLTVLHVFTDTTKPAMLDHPMRDLHLIGREFLARHFPRAADIELRSGPIATRVAEVSEARAIDLIVLSWAQDSSAERAGVIRAVLSASKVPVLLLPLPTASVDLDAG
jgi:nucleotide-binding universal stress UspA family protein